MQPTFSKIYSLQSSVVFTHEKEINNSMSFLDVLVEKSSKKFITLVYRKLRFTGQYTRWDSFGPKMRKSNLIGTLAHRSLEICSPEKFTK